MTVPKHWSLGAKLALVGLPFLLLALLSTAATLWVSWQLDGGAAAVNEAGRMRMQSYRMALSIGTGETGALAQQVKEFNQSLATLRSGDPERPVFVPWDDRQLKVAFATFRDRLRPGQSEKWTVKVTGPAGRDAAVSAAEVEVLRSLLVVGDVGWVSRGPIFMICSNGP